ncbi:MAG: transposase [Arthrobacter sp.]
MGPYQPKGHRTPAHPDPAQHAGFGPVLAAEFLGSTGGDVTVFETADRFAGVIGLAQ